MPKRERARTLWGAVNSDDFQQDEENSALKRRRRDLLEHWREHPRHYLEGVDDTVFHVDMPDGKTIYYPKGRPLVWTKDEGDDKEPIKPWPTHLPHVRALLEEMHAGDYRGLFGDKVRQVLFTLTAAQYCDHACKFKPIFNVLWSKITEAQAIVQLEDKIRFPHSMLPAWVQEALPLKPTPQNVLKYYKPDNKSRITATIQAITQNAAAGLARGGTVALVVIDEAAFQEYAGDIIGAVKPAAAKYWVFTTPDIGTPGAKAVRKYLDMPTVREGTNHHIQGFAVRWISDNMKVIEIDNEAIPARRDPKWQLGVLAEYPGGETDPDYMRERQRNWSVGRGTGYFQQFAQDPERYILRGDETGKLFAKEVIHRGRDFGERRPACVWLQKDPTRPRIYVHHELLGEHIGAHDFRDITMYISGELGYDALGHVCQQRLAEIDAAHRAQGWPTTPWFPGINNRPGAMRPFIYADWSSWEARKTSSAVATDAEAKTDEEILAARGIHLQLFAGKPYDMGKVLIYLLRDQDDGLPGLLISEHCPLLIEAFSGALQYRKPTLQNPEPGEWAKNGVHDNVIEALGHAVANIIDVDDLMRLTTETERIRLEGRQTWGDDGGSEESIGLGSGWDDDSAIE